MNLRRLPGDDFHTLTDEDGRPRVYTLAYRQGIGKHTPITDEQKGRRLDLRLARLYEAVSDSSGQAEVWAHIVPGEKVWTYTIRARKDGGPEP